jgi:hypothetical protein
VARPTGNKDAPLPTMAPDDRGMHCWLNHAWMGDVTSLCIAQMRIVRSVRDSMNVYDASSTKSSA